MLRVSPSYLRACFSYSTIARVKAISASSYHSMVLMQDGSVWSTGNNQCGQLGDESTDPENSLTKVLSSGSKAISAGYEHGMVLKQDGSVWATGENNFGQLGDGSQAFRSKFVQVISGGVQGVAAGDGHSMVLKKDGSLWARVPTCMVRSQLGDGSIVSKNIFVRVLISRDGVCYNRYARSKV